MGPGTGFVTVTRYTAVGTTRIAAVLRRVRTFDQVLVATVGPGTGLVGITRYTAVGTTGIAAMIRRIAALDEVLVVTRMGSVTATRYAAIRTISITVTRL